MFSAGPHAAVGEWCADDEGMSPRLPRGAILALIAAATLAACAPSHSNTLVGAEAEPTVSPRTRTTPTACTRPAPSTATDWQTLFEDLDPDLWSGGDVAATTPLPDGRTVWLFGDTLRGPGGRTTVQHNSMLLGRGGCLESVPGPGGGEPIPTRADGQWYWPLHGIVDAGRLHVFAMSVKATGSRPADFTGTGTEIATFDLHPSAAPVLADMQRTPATGKPETTPQWGAALVQRRGFIYVYGTQRVHQNLVFGRNVYLARVPVGHLTDLSRWRYWDGRAWVADPARAAVVIDAQHGVPTSFSVQPGPAGSVTAIAKKDDFLGSQVISLSAPAPQGAWGSARFLQRSPSDLRRGTVTYLALGHPDLPLASGGLLVTVSRNNLDPAVVEADPTQYRPKFYDLPVR